MQKSFLRQNVLPVLAAVIWGTAFVAQSVCAPYVPPFAFNAIRALIAFVLLIFVSIAFDKAAARKGTPPAPTDWKKLLLGGVCTGAFLAIASNLQQAGLADTSAGKAGFITALYVVLVPVLGIFLKRRASGQTWISVVIAVGGLYLLCIRAGEGFHLQTSDVYILLCAFFFACQIMSIDHFGADVDGIKLSCVQFLVAGVISAVLSLIFETLDWSAVMEHIWPILYVAVFSSCVAYTFQILAQQGSDPTVVTLLLSLESVFSVIAGALILRDRLSGREYLGCVLMFAAVVLAQVPLKKRKVPLKKRKDGLQ